ncbi:hypothetical protein RRG08_014349 [Elysia crispata]|uniref:Uncharacterized protein n=1 Tax=Elysia crispata TaxID=231223 RepID=A0AAE1CJV7_9GAST|nr:hypothetical protein RRG08_014349 [Elysia crispata]
MRSAVNRPQRGEPENLRWPPRMCEIAPGSTQQANTVYTEKLVSTSAHQVSQGEGKGTSEEAHKNGNCQEGVGHQTREGRNIVT